MSGRFSPHEKGSSRSARDDSRTSRDRHERRSRSRSPRRRHSPGRRKYSEERSHSSRDGDKNHERRRRHSNSPEEEVPAPPPPPRITKISIGFTKPTAPIKMNISATKAPAPAPKPTVASVFNDDDDDEEEMPAEAKMRMRNIGRETPTSAGPNSFGKTKQGFCDSKKVFEKNLKAAMDEADQKPALLKFPQTIYKIKPNSL